MPKRQWKQRNGKRRWTRLRALPRLLLLANLGKAEIVSDENVRLAVNENLRIGNPVAKTQRLAANVRHPDATANPLRTDSGVNADPTISVRDRSGGKRNNLALSNPENQPEPAAAASRDEQLARRRQEPVAEPIQNREELEATTGEILGYLIAAMNVDVEAYVLDELRDGSIVFEIEGADAGLLIGRRGETLRDLQFIVRMLVNRQLKQRANIIIDVERYQLRRTPKASTP